MMLYTDTNLVPRQGQYESVYILSKYWYQADTKELNTSTLLVCKTYHYNIGRESLILINPDGNQQLTVN
jgi:hypothetical protein